MSKSKLDNTETNMVAYENGYVLTQTELCNKLPPIKKEFERIREHAKQNTFHIYFNEKL